MTGSHIRYEEAGGIAEIIICRPEKRNALTAAMMSDFLVLTEDGLTP